MKRVVLVDSNSVLYRSYHALPRLTTKDGRPTGALYGFLRILGKLLREPHSHFIVVGDGAGPLARAQIYNEYKAQRPKAPDDLKIQRKMLPSVLDELGVPYAVEDGVEADDLIASLAKAFASWGFQVQVFTSDTDMLQLVDKAITVSLLKKGLSEVVNYDSAAFTSEFGFPPGRYVDYKSLVGDSADNIPGIAGIGSVRAKQLVEELTREELVERFGPSFDRNVKLIELSQKSVGYELLLARVRPGSEFRILEELQFETLKPMVVELLKPVEGDFGLFGTSELDRLPWKIVSPSTPVTEPFPFAFTSGSEPLQSAHELYAETIGVKKLPMNIYVNGEPCKVDKSVAMALVNAGSNIRLVDDALWVEL